MEITIDGVSVISIEEALETLKKSRATLYRWIGEGKVKVVKTSDRTYIPVSEIERLKEELQSVNETEETEKETNKNGNNAQ